MTMSPTLLATRNTGVMDQPQDHDSADRDRKVALLRPEAIYASHISEWRKARDLGKLPATATRKSKCAEQIELEKLRKLKERLEAELKKAQLASDITGTLGTALRERERRTEATEAITAAFDELAAVVGIKRTYHLLGHSRAGHCRATALEGCPPLPIGCQSEV